MNAVCACGPHMGIHQFVALISDAKQAKSEGESHLVETTLTELVATALFVWTRTVLKDTSKSEQW